MLFVIQNNGYAISVPQATQTASEIHRIAYGFNMPSFKLDGTLFQSLYHILPPVISRIRQGSGPALVSCPGDFVRSDPSFGIGVGPAEWPC